MRGRHTLFVPTLALTLGVLAGVLAPAGMRAYAASASMSMTTGGNSASMGEAMRKSRPTLAQRQAAASRAAAARSTTFWGSAAGSGPLFGTATWSFTPRGTPDYFGVYPNWANSPVIRKFVDTLPGLGADNANNLGQYLPIAVADTTTYPGSDYYEIGLVDYQQRLHSDLPATKLRGYKDMSPKADGVAHYLGPVILARKDRPVRVKFDNLLGTGAAGNLFIPVDTTVMGAGAGPEGGSYSENRATIHLHGGDTPWISDGTPHQWITPASEVTTYTKGVSQRNVPDMPDPGAGSATFYYPNQISSRMLWYHDHAYGLTRLNVYAGEVAGYLLTDAVEDSLIDSGTIPGKTEGVYRYGVPLVIQDKTFVPDPASLAAQDPTWDTAAWGGQGNLWFPHVYMPNQNPSDSAGVNAMGRWDYGAWFWPPVTTIVNGPIANPLYPTASSSPTIPGTPNPSLVPEAFMDTPLVNGTAYPTMAVDRKSYRFRILNGCNDRTLNLQLYYVDPAAPTEVKMVPAVAHPGDPTWPSTWPTDGRAGGVPDPKTAGPDIIQIGSEGGFLPAPVEIPSQPVGYIYDRRNIVVLNIQEKALMLGPAERADIIVDFSKVPAGSKLILYNDAPAPVPAFDPRIDYYTGAPDLRPIGGANTPQPGYGPNTRTIMRFDVGTGPAASAFSTATLNAAWPAAYATAQDPPIVPETAYGAPTDTYARIQDTSLSYVESGNVLPTTTPLQPKAIQELFELDYGRMNATLGTELPFTTFFNQTTLPFGYIDPITEVIENNHVQIWKITHNGVDTHAIHVHLFNVQVINRVGWDGQIRPPDPNELGWKETVRMNPLEDAIIALKPVAPTLPFSVSDSVRLLDPTAPAGATWQTADPTTGNPITVTNELTDYGWEYVWHCHLLGHEENDMMRPVKFEVP
jgi:FtsP/CotA-like multicopper oxidase with cupredoxin domain